ncbi:MAG: ATP-binding cassette domain-containing protein, partial [Anaerolineae bacterium]
FRRYDVDLAKRTVRAELSKMGIDIRDPNQPVGTLSGGERQSIAISRAIYFGAKVLILDEPTAALGIKQAGIVLHYVVQTKKQGLGVIFISHNPNHAYLIGDHFIILRRGRILGDYRKEELDKDQLMNLMAGGEDLKSLQEELQEFEERL